MKYHSTRSTNKNQGVSLSYAVLKGLADDGGLYMPESILQLEQSFIENLHTYSLPEIGFIVAKTLIGNEVPDNILKPLVEEALNFPIPLVKVTEGIYSLELFHGPTM